MNTEEEIIKELAKDLVDDDWCHYSGMPNPAAYEKARIEDMAKEKEEQL